MPKAPPKPRLSIIGEFPGETELRSASPFVGNAGGVLRGFLLGIGVDLDQEAHLTNVWMHEPTDDPDDLAWNREIARWGARHSPVVFLLGSSASREYLGYPVTDVTGLLIRTEAFPGIVVPAPNPVQLFYGNAGEFSLAVTRLETALQKKRWPITKLPTRIKTTRRKTRGN